MPHSFAMLYVHVVFSTKHRLPILELNHIQALRRYASTIAEEEDAKLLTLGGWKDHVHCLISMPLSKAPSEIVRAIKANTSRWLKKDQGLENFAWQIGYSLISVSPDRLKAVSAYIDKQEQHHKGLTFEDEMRGFQTRTE